MLCFVGEGEGGDAAAWDSGEVGGYEAYLLADDDKEPAEVYKAVSAQGGAQWGGGEQAQPASRLAGTGGGGCGPEF